MLQHLLGINALCKYMSSQLEMTLIQEKFSPGSRDPPLLFQAAEYHGLSEPEKLLQLQWQNGGSRVCGHCWMTSILLPSTRWPHSTHAQTAFKSSLLQPGLHKTSFDFSATMLVANVEFMGVAWGLCDLLCSIFCCIKSSATIAATIHCRN